MKEKLVKMLGRSKIMVLAVVVALVLVAAPAALAANGKPFILGKAKNVATKTSGLVGKVGGGAAALLVKNIKGGPALDLQVGNADVPANEVAPMKVNSNKKVESLNADLLDDKSADEFAADANKNGKADDAEHADQAANATNAQSANTANNANNLGGQPPSAYQRRVSSSCSPNSSIRIVHDNGTVTCESSADKLDNLDSTAFAGSGRSNYRVGATLTPCTEQVLSSQTISPSRSALVYASGVAVYRPNDSNLTSGLLRVELRDATNTNTLASGGTFVASGNGGEASLSVQGLLMSGTNVYNSSTPFEVTPGNSYVLRLVGSSSNGSCAGSPSMSYIALTHMLVGK